MFIEPAKPEDIDTIIALESHPENRDFLWIGTQQEHQQEIDDPAHLLLVFRKKEKEHILGYTLIRLDHASKRFEIRRIAIEEKGEGYGREAMVALLEFAFKELQMNRVWLDVYPHNTMGIALYEKLGMKREGILRQNYYSEEKGYLDQIIYSILRSEYKSLK